MCAGAGGGCIGSEVCADATATTRASGRGWGWEPQTPQEEGLQITYEWIRGELIRRGGGLAAALSLVSSLSGGEARGLVIVLFCAVAWIGVEHLGYV